MLSNDVLVVIWPYIFYKICPINKTVDILQMIHTNAQTNDVTAYHIGLACILSNDRLKTSIGNHCLKGYMGDKHEKKICCNCIYYPNVVQSVTKRTHERNYSASTSSNSMNKHIKERKLNNDSGPIGFQNIPIKEEFLYGYN